MEERGRVAAAAVVGATGALMCYARDLEEGERIHIAEDLRRGRRQEVESSRLVTEATGRKSGHASGETSDASDDYDNNID